MLRREGVTHLAVAAMVTGEAADVDIGIQAAAARVDSDELHGGIQQTLRAGVHEVLAFFDSAPPDAE